MSWPSTMTLGRALGEIASVMEQDSAAAAPAGGMRPRDLGMSFGPLPTGRTNTIVDVGDLRVGHATVHDDDRGVHTGVTAILNDDLAAGLPLPAALYVGNGYGKLVGATQIGTTGQVETPVMLTSTLSTFRVADHLITWMQGRRATALRSINPVVGEINDTWLSAEHDHRLEDEAVVEALDSASRDVVAGGNVGGGAGACALGFKAGIGSASRRVRVRGQEHHLGVLVQANMTGELRLQGRRVTPGSLGLPVAGPTSEEGSCMVVVAVDFPCSPHELERIARRGVFGLGRVGAAYSHGSGDYAISLSTDRRVAPGLRPADLDEVFGATLDCVEEAVIDALCAADTVELSTGRVAHRVPDHAWTDGLRP